MAFTVKQLKALLRSMPDNYQVIVSSDEEGNMMSPLESYGVGIATPKESRHNLRRGCLVDFADSSEDAAKANAILLYPSH